MGIQSEDSLPNTFFKQQTLCLTWNKNVKKCGHERPINLDY